MKTLFWFLTAFLGFAALAFYVGELGWFVLTLAVLLWATNAVNRGKL